jgi:hypothetical protein
VQDKLAHARECLADAERLENSLATRVDAAVQALCFLGEFPALDSKIGRYLHMKYERHMPSDVELERYLAYALALAKRLLSKMEHK